MVQKIAIVGGGVAAHSVLSALTSGIWEKDGLTVDVYSAERHRPYRRPAVNKDILIDGKSAEDVQHKATPFEHPGVTFHAATPVVGLNLDGREVRLEDGATESYDAVVLATGARPRIIDAPYFEGREVRYVREPDDAVAVREVLLGLSAEDNVVVVGGGLLGLEAAAGARSVSEASVTVLEREATVCSRVLPKAASAWLVERHTGEGISIRSGLDDAEMAAAVEELDPKLIIVAVGVERNIALAEKAGIDVNRGILVDECGRSSAEGFFAVGDCVEFGSADAAVPLIEDEGSARRLGHIVGTLLADGETGGFHDEPVRGWSRQLGAMINIAGFSGVGEGRKELVVKQDADELIVFTLGGVTGQDSVVGVTTVGRSPEVRKAKSALGWDLAQIEEAFFAEQPNP